MIQNTTGQALGNQMYFWSCFNLEPGPGDVQSFCQTEITLTLSDHVTTLHSINDYYKVYLKSINEVTESYKVRVGKDLKIF